MPNIDFYNWTRNINQKASKTWNKVCYSVPNKQKPSTIPRKKCNDCVWVSVVQLVAKVLKAEKFKCELDKFLEFIPDEPKMPNYVTAARSNNILDQLSHLKAQRIYQGGVVPVSVMEQA